MSGYKINIIAGVTITAEELADGFWKLDELEQARFFNALGQIVEGRFSDFVMQLAHLSKAKNLSKSGRRAMELLGEYSSEE